MEKSIKRLDIKPLYLDEEILNLLKKGKKYALQIREQDQTEVVLGYSSSPEKEVNIDNILKDSINIYRRKGGGCSVVLLPGMIIISIGYQTTSFRGFSEAMLLINKKIIQVLKLSGVRNINQAGISDLAINNKKILGCSLHRGKEFSIYQGSLIFDSKLNLVDRYLKHPPREPEYRKGRKHMEFITNLSEEYPDVNKKVLIKNLKNTLDKPFWR